MSNKVLNSTVELLASVGTTAFRTVKLIAVVGFSKLDAALKNQEPVVKTETPSTDTPSVQDTVAALAVAAVVVLLFTVGLKTMLVWTAGTFVLMVVFQMTRQLAAEADAAAAA